MRDTKQSTETFKLNQETKLYKVEPEGLSAVGSIGEVRGYLNKKDAIFYSAYDRTRKLVIIEYTIPANTRMWHERNDKKLFGTKQATVTNITSVFNTACA